MVRRDQRQPGKIIVVNGHFEADSYIQHLMTFTAVDFATGNGTAFSDVAGGACFHSTSRVLSTRIRAQLTSFRDLTFATVLSFFVIPISLCYKGAILSIY